MIRGDDAVAPETAAPGWALCHTVSACASVGDFERAAQWCRALHAWSAAWQARHFLGVCRTAYGEVLAAEAHQPFQEAPDEFDARVDMFWRELERRG